MKFFNLVLSKITFSSDIINEYLINLLPLKQWHIWRITSFTNRDRKLIFEDRLVFLWSAIPEK